MGQTSCKSWAAVRQSALLGIPGNRNGDKTLNVQGFVQYVPFIGCIKLKGGENQTKQASGRVSAVPGLYKDKQHVVAGTGDWRLHLLLSQGQSAVMCPVWPVGSTTHCSIIKEVETLCESSLCFPTRVGLKKLAGCSRSRDRCSWGGMVSAKPHDPLLAGVKDQASSNQY